MKSKHLLCVLLILAGFSLRTFGLDIYVDQANEFFDPEGNSSLYNIEYFRPVGQEFRPSLNALNFVDLMLWDFYGPQGYQYGGLKVYIHQSTIDGPIIGSSSTLTLPFTYEGEGRFTFPALVPLIPGETYVLQVRVVSGGDWGVGFSGAPVYAGGRVILQGMPIEEDDLFFREGLIDVPEPGCFRSFVLALITTFGLRRLQYLTKRKGA